MASDAFEATKSMSTQAKNLMERASQLAQDMGHHVMDPSHLIVAVLASHHDGTFAFPTGSFPLVHPMHRNRAGHYEPDMSRGLGLSYESALNLVHGSFRVPLEDLVVQHYTEAMRTMLARAKALAEEERSRRDRPYDNRTEISVFNLVWAAVESGSGPIDLLIPDKQHAMYEFFRVTVDTESEVPASVHAAVTGQTPTIQP